MLSLRLSFFCKSHSLVKDLNRKIKVQDVLQEAMREELYVGLGLD